MSSLQHHIHLGPEHLAGNGGLGRYVFLPGDRSRAARIAEGFSDVVVVDNPRGLTAHLGRIEQDGHCVDALAISSGMGTASTEIVLRELLCIGARRVVRVGSCGAMDPNIRPGQVAIVTGAVRDELATRHIAPLEFPAVAHPAAVEAMTAGARAAGLSKQVYLGIGHTKASLYAREFGHGPLGDENRAYGAVLARCGTIASDMEAAMLFVMASAASAGKACAVGQGNAEVAVQTACVLGVYGGDDSDMDLDPEVCRTADARAIAVARNGVLAWAHMDGVISLR